MALSNAEPIQGETLAEVSNAIVRLFSRYYGRGPTKARSHFFDGYVLTVMEDTLTTVERTLVSLGRQDLVRAVRLTFQEEMAPEFMAAVGAATGREVVSYHSQITFEPERCFELFALGDAPFTGEPPG